MIICDKCGSENSDERLICHDCGRELINRSTESSEKSKKQEYKAKEATDSTYKCPKCGNNAVPDAVFCNKCGLNFKAEKIYCTTCGEPNTSLSDFCSKCGKTLSGKIGSENPIGTKNGSFKKTMIWVCVGIISVMLILTVLTVGFFSNIIVDTYEHEDEIFPYRHFERSIIDEII